MVGAGPVGLTTAHELARRGIATRVVDRAAGPATTSRATATHARTLEVYHQMGILEDVLPRGRKVENFTVHRKGRALGRLGTDYSQLPTRFPFTLQIDQVYTEEVLRERLKALGVEVEWSLELERVTTGDEHAEVRLRHADGTTEELTVPWLVGAEGAHSTVRKQLGMHLLGDSSETWLLADAVVDADLPSDSLHWMHLSRGTIMMVPFPAEGKWRLLDTVDTEGADDPDAIAERFAAKISEGLGKPVKVHTPTWVSVFTIRQRMVPSMRSGRCFLAGDAAHVHSPASGQGMNTGIQDGHNLGWKLAAVILGHAEEKLLDTYSVERVPVGEALLGSTSTATGLIALRNAAAPVLLPLGFAVLNSVAPLKRSIERKILKTMSGLSMNYERSPLTTAPAGGTTTGIAPGGRVGCSRETERASAGWREMCAELADPRWTLLAFAPARHQLAALEEVNLAYGPAVSVRTVHDGPDTGQGPHPLADPGQVLRRDLGAAPGDFVLVRPDGYLAEKGSLAGPRQPAAALGAVHLIAHRPTTK